MKEQPADAIDRRVQRWTERIIETLIRASGLSVLLILFAIVILIALESLPLISPPRATELAPGEPLANSLESDFRASQIALRDQPTQPRDPLQAIAPDLRLVIGQKRSDLIYIPRDEPLLTLRHAEATGQGYLAADGRSGIIELADGSFQRYQFEIGFPGLSLGSLFSFEAWRTSGSGTEGYSLVPLFFGSLKGAGAGLLIAGPLGILAALGVGQLNDRSLRRSLRDGVEMLSMFPSTVLAIIAILWAGPLLEAHLLTLFLSPLVFLTLLVTSGAMIPRRYNRHPQILLTVPLLVAILGVSLLWLSESLWPEPAFAASQWIESRWGIAYQQRNALLVGIFLGVAMTPMVFSLTTTALAAVPRNLLDGASALGATPSQVALRIALPLASGGILSALLLALARALGETMILVMVSGNSGILKLNPFEGMRSAAANMAIELPEAAPGNALYHLIFLTAFLLFAVTFVINLAAALLKARLRSSLELWR